MAKTMNGQDNEWAQLSLEISDNYLIIISSSLVSQPLLDWDLDLVVDSDLLAGEVDLLGPDWGDLRLLWCPPLLKLLEISTCTFPACQGRLEEMCLWTWVFPALWGLQQASTWRCCHSWTLVGRVASAGSGVQQSPRCAKTETDKRDTLPDTAPLFSRRLLHMDL